VNPDDPRDAQRLYRELPLVREMAIRAIEERFQILTSSTEYRQHLYELSGWKEILGNDLIGRLLSGEGPLPDEVVDMPDINIRLRTYSPYTPLEGMTIAGLAVEGATVHLSYRPPDKLLEFRFSLDFENERLIFDIHQGVFGHDDGSVAVAEYLKEAQRFGRDYLLNGELQIWNATTGKLISRKDAFIPLNCFVNLDGCNARIAAAQAEIDRRRTAREIETEDA
jgi:hypothetical protein